MIHMSIKGTVPAVTETDGAVETKGFSVEVQRKISATFHAIFQLIGRLGALDEAASSRHSYREPDPL